ncbi:MAG: DUF6455 family protein [Hyphomicrobiaceae bacterium]
MPNREPLWPMFRRVWRRAELTDRMINDLGVDPIVAARLDKGEAYREACAICLACPVTRVCRNWMTADEGHDQPPDFCPNAHFFGRCRSSQEDVH